ncbi:unnamed protein product [Pedinophyceae sp. YPF-701]|nr:unnamed protein product [Pedinophyceae sp. YPF-701]
MGLFGSCCAPKEPAQGPDGNASTGRYSPESNGGAVELAAPRVAKADAGSGALPVSTGGNNADADDDFESVGSFHTCMTTASDLSASWGRRTQTPTQMLPPSAVVSRQRL